MNNFKYNPIKMTPFKWFVLENFPFIEEDFDSLTSYGLWCKLKKYFDDVATKTNATGEQTEKLTKAFIALENYIENYFKNLDVQDEINTRLDELVLDGTLSTLIFKKDYYKFSNLNVRRIARWILNNGNNNINYNDEAYFATAQGSCIIDENTIAIAYTPTNDSYNLTDRTLIRIYSLSTGSVLREAEFNFGHANSLLYKDNKLYISECFTRNNTSNYNYSKNVYVISADNLTYIETKTINSLSNDMFLNISYDSIKNKWYAMQRFIVYELDDNFNVINTINLKNTDIVEKGTYQVIHAHNGYFYVLNAYPNQLIIYDNNGDIVQYYKIPDWAEDSFFIGEAEDISFIGEDIYLTSNKSLCEEGDSNVTQVFVLNTSINKSVHDTNKTLPNTRKRLIVNNNFKINPDGSSNNGFNELAEAIEFCLSPKGINVSYINVNAGNYKYSSILNIKNTLRINGVGDTTIVGGLSVLYCSKIILQNMKLVTTNNSELGNFNLLCLYSNTELNTINFDLTNENYKNIISNSHGTLELYNSIPSTISDDIVFIRNSTLGTLKYRGNIKNIISSGNYNNIGMYPITDNINLAGGDVPKNSFMEANNINTSDLLYTNRNILFEFIDGSERTQFITFNTRYISGSNNYFKINSVEITDDNYYINEMTVRHQNNQFAIIRNKSKDKEGNIVTARIILNKIYVYND